MNEQTKLAFGKATPLVKQGDFGESLEISPRKCGTTLNSGLWATTRNVASRKTIAVCTPKGHGILFVVSGWMIRTRQLGNGRRQILEVLLPGEHSSIDATPSAISDTFTALSTCEIGLASAASVHAMIASSPELGMRLAADEVRRRAILEERVVSLGQRSSLQRMAHFICELHTRLKRDAPEDVVMFPLTQSDLSELLGLSTVHTNRMIQTLRRRGLIEVSRRTLRVRDFPVLALEADFSSAYLDV